jgi:signal transduction histidine kinase
MPAPTAHSSLTRQLVAPVVGLVLAAVLANVGFAAWLAARRSAAAAEAAQARVADSLAAARVSLSAAVLDALRRLTGSHFVVWDETTRSAGLSTLAAEDLRSLDVAALVPGRQGTVIGRQGLVSQGTVTIAGVQHRFGTVPSGGVRPETVIVLTPARPVLAATLEAVWPVLAVAAATLAVLVPLGLRTTGRLAARIGAVERHVARIARGEFGHVLGRDAGPAGDEIGRLVAGVDHMSGQLEALRTSLLSGERQRLLGQLAAGFAHELRNAVTGARLAIDLHRRRCPGAVATGSAPDESLAVASRQLEILEEEVRGLLALGRPAETAATAVLADRLLDEVRDLTQPRCAHAGVRLERGPPSGLSLVGRRDALRAALVNLALNGIDAAGRGGLVRLSAFARDGAAVLAIDDSGEGPPQDLRDTMHEPFVTGKPEGIGLGLTVARAVAEEHGGGLEWERMGGRTRFAIFLPERTLEDVPADHALPADSPAPPRTLP